MAGKRKEQQEQQGQETTQEAQAESQGENGEGNGDGGPGGAGQDTSAAATAAPAAPDVAERLEAEIAELKDRNLRLLAEMDNIRRRTEREKEDARKFASEGLLSDLLPALDNFARALQAAEQTTDFGALKNGVDLTHRQLLEALTRHGLKKIEAAGQPFDPNLHEAIMQVPPQEGQEAHRVVEELRSGYTLNDRVLRPTLVKVTSA